eukprot:3983699-Prorocentrum_lima.AAC.1
MAVAPGKWLNFDATNRHPEWADNSLRSNSHARGGRPPTGRQQVEQIIARDTIIGHPRHRDRYPEPPAEETSPPAP